MTIIRAAGRDQQHHELDEHSPQAEQPRGLRGIQLKPHQRALLQRCLEMEAGHTRVLLPDEGARNGVGRESWVRSRLGIMGDIAGAGKTAVALALIFSSSHPEAAGRDGGHARRRCYADGMVTLETGLRPVGAAMVVFPHNLAVQWVEYAAAVAPEAAAVVCVTRAPHLHLLDWGRVADSRCDLLLVSSTMYSGVVEAARGRRLSFSRVFYDEADSVANFPKDSELADAGFVWFMTASYRNLLYPHGDDPKDWRQRRSQHASMLRASLVTGGVLPNNNDGSGSGSSNGSEDGGEGEGGREDGDEDGGEDGNGDGDGDGHGGEDGYGDGGGRGAAPPRCPPLVDVTTRGLPHRSFVKRLFSGIFSSGGTAAEGQALMLALVAKNADRFAARSMRLLPLVEIRVPCRPPGAVDVLMPADESLADPRILQHLHACDEPGAMAFIRGGQGGSQENVIERLVAALGREDAALSSRIQLTRDLMVFVSEDDRASELRLLEAMQADTRRRMECIRARIRDSGRMCCVCYEELGAGGRTRVVTPCCSNSFCAHCTSVWFDLSDACPLCKASPLSTDDLITVADHPAAAPASAPAPSPQPAPQPPSWSVPHDLWDPVEMKRASRTCDESSKAGNLRAIVGFLTATVPCAKVMIFASYNASFAMAARVLEEEQVSFCTLNGNAALVAAKVRTYKKRDGELQALMANAQNYGSGLNLENTTDVVLLNDLPASLEHQVVGRGNRMGRTSPLRVWHLQHPGEQSRRG